MSTAKVQTPKLPSESLRELPLNLIFPSATNPRSHFPEDYINELAESLLKDGMLNDLLVRPATALAEDVKRARDAGIKPAFGPGDDAYELIAGGCRYRAAGLAEMEVVPVKIRHLDDDSVLLLQVIENLKRKDLDVLDEATGYQRLRDRGFSQQDIADKVGVSISTISSRIRLLTAIPEAKQLLSEALLPPGHAVLIARLDETTDQMRALRSVYDEYDQYHSSKKMEVLELARTLHDQGEPIMPEKQLREWIKDNCNLELKGAPWDLADPDLYPEAGACTACQFKSGNSPALFSELSSSDSTCMKPDCFNKKKSLFVQIQTKYNPNLVPLSVKQSAEPPKEGATMLKAGQWVESHKGECPSTVEGIFKDGEEAGKTRHVCWNVKCKKHKHSQTIQDNSAIPSQSRGNDWEAENKKREQDCGIEQSVRFGRAIGVLKEIDSLTDPILYAVASTLIHDAVGYQVWGKLLEHAGISGKLSETPTKSPIFAKAVVAALLCPNMETHYSPESGRQEFHQTIISFGPKFKKMLEKWEAPEKPQAQTSETKPKPAAKKSEPVKQAKPVKAKGKIKTTVKTTKGKAKAAKAGKR